jgi:hypothetical protein
MAERFGLELNQFQRFGQEQFVTFHGRRRKPLLS